VGISTGTYEAVMLLDGEERFGGMGVRKAARNVNEVISPELVGMDVAQQRAIDQRMIEMDGTPNKSKLGANSIVGVSLAVAKAAAAASDLPLYRYIGGANACVIPMPIIGIGVGGGARYRDAGNSRWYKPSYEYVPFGAGSFMAALEVNWEVRRQLRAIITERFGRGAVQARGIHLTGLIKHDAEILDAMTEAIIKAGQEGQVGIYFDCAADCYYEADIDRYVGLFSEGEKDRDQLLAQYLEFVNNYPIVSLEDVVREDDLEGMALFTKELGIEIVGDDFFTTSIERLKAAVPLGAANSMVIKITQVGSVSEALEACEYARTNGINLHPCGSRGDVESIVDVAVGLNAGQIRAFNFNRLLTIEEELGDAAIWPGKSFFKGWRNQS
jgi:enolase